MENTTSASCKSQIELLPALSSHIYKDWSGYILHHPYIVERCYEPSMNLSLNQRYQAIDKIIREGFSQGIFNHMLIQDPYKLQILLENEHLITDENLWWEYVKEIYLLEDDISRYHQEYTDIFNGKYRKNSDLLMTGEEQKLLSELPESIDVYRGCTDAEDSGFSYTLDKEIASWLASRFEAKDAVVIEKTVQKKDIVCFFDTPGQEIILRQAAL